MKLYPIASSDVHSMKLRHQLLKDVSCTTLRENISNPNTGKILAAYTGVCSRKNVNFGCSTSFLRKGATELVLRITDATEKVAKEKASSVSVKVESISSRAMEELKNKLHRAVSLDEVTPEISYLTSTSRGADGFFEIPVSHIDRKTNQPLLNIKVVEALFADENANAVKNKKIGLDYSPVQEFAKSKLKKFTSKGMTSFENYDIVSKADTVGALKFMENFDDIVNYKGQEPICVVMDSKSALEQLMLDARFNEDFVLPVNVKAIIARKPRNPKGEYVSDKFLDNLSHAKARMDGKQALILAGDEIMDKLKSSDYGNVKFVNLIANTECLDIVPLKNLPVTDNKVALEPIKMAKGLLTSSSNGFLPEAVGIKAYNLGRLAEMAEDGGFEVPKFFAIQAGEIDLIKKANPLIYHRSKDMSKNGIYHTYMKVLDDAYENGAPIDTGLESMQNVINKDMKYPQSFIERSKAKIQDIFGFLPERRNLDNTVDEGVILSVRSSFPNFEDLDKVSTQGMFSSVGGVRTFDEYLAAVKKVWASKWGNVAYRKRMEHSIPHDSVQPAILVQEFVKDIDYIFTGYTRKVGEPNKLLIDFSQGVTSNMQGNPYLFELNRETGEIQRTLMASKGRKKNIEHVDLLDKKNTKYTDTDYSNDPLNLSHDEYAPIVKKISDILLFVEKKFGGQAQDIEGGIKFVRDAQGNIKDVKTTLWQTRDVQMPS